MTIKEIQEERRNDYGDPKNGFGDIAKLWSVYINRKYNLNDDTPLDATDVAVMMVLMKTARFAFKRKEDTALDLSSYADFVWNFTKEIE